MIAGDTYGRGVTRWPVGGARPSEQEPNNLQLIADRAQVKCAMSMVSHPLTTVLVAITLGVTLGWLIKRR